MNILKEIETVKHLVNIKKGYLSTKLTSNSDKHPYNEDFVLIEALKEWKILSNNGSPKKYKYIKEAEFLNSYLDDSLKPEDYFKNDFDIAYYIAAMLTKDENEKIKLLLACINCKNGQILVPEAYSMLFNLYIDLFKRTQNKDFYVLAAKLMPLLALFFSNTKEPELNETFLDDVIENEEIYNNKTIIYNLHIAKHLELEVAEYALEYSWEIVSNYQHLKLEYDFPRVLIRNMILKEFKENLPTFKSNLYLSTKPVNEISMKEVNYLIDYINNKKGYIRSMPNYMLNETPTRLELDKIENLKIDYIDTNYIFNLFKESDFLNQYALETIQDSDLELYDFDIAYYLAAKKEKNIRKKIKLLKKSILCSNGEILVPDAFYELFLMYKKLYFSTRKNTYYRIGMILLPAISAFKTSNQNMDEIQEFLNVLNEDEQFMKKHERLTMKHEVINNLYLSNILGNELTQGATTNNKLILKFIFKLDFENSQPTRYIHENIADALKNNVRIPDINYLLDEQ